MDCLEYGRQVFGKKGYKKLSIHSKVSYLI